MNLNFPINRAGLLIFIKIGRGSNWYKNVAYILSFKSKIVFV